MDDSITRFFQSVPHEKSNITVHQLLTHTAGFHDTDAADGITNRKDAVTAVLKQPLTNKPGERFKYTNDAYTLIAAIIEIAAQQPFEKYLHEQIVKPNGLKQLVFGAR